ncbi:MAG: hypothetical protein D6776_07325 [Planctomycetota bacterium]|nr:MAG: hypothetical protein D6776_07325 [Planctomycetota bacterium]
MRVVSDFDGVWTEPDGEAQAVGAWQCRRLAEALGGDEPAAAALLERVRAAVRARPERHGWRRAGGLTCYADEDPYVFHNAVAAALWDEEPEARAELAAHGFESAEAFAWRCFEEATAAWARAGAAPLLASAIEAVQELLDRGCEVWIVSNGSNERIRTMLEGGCPGLLAHPRLRLRGDARKFELEPPGREAAAEDPLRLHGRAVRTARPHYRRLLEQIEPDLVIGDNLSLDLALPLALRRSRRWARRLEIVLKRNRYTPRWSLEASAAHGIGTVSRLAELAARLG